MTELRIGNIIIWSDNLEVSALYQDEENRMRNFLGIRYGKETGNEVYIEHIDGKSIDVKMCNTESDKKIFEISEGRE